MNTDAREHGYGAAVVFLDFIPTTMLRNALDGQSRNIVIADGGGFESTGGTVLVDEEMIHFTEGQRRSLIMPALLNRQGEENGGLFRGRYGTLVLDHDADSIVMAMPFRYWDRYVPLQDSGELSFYGFSMDLPGAFFHRLVFDKFRPGQSVDLHVLCRTEGDVSWADEPGETQVGRLQRHLDGSSRLEAHSRAAFHPRGLPGRDEGDRPGVFQMTRAASKSVTHEGGFTILELLTAMALLAALGALLVTLVQNSFDMYTEGDRRADLYQTGMHVLSQLEDDLQAVHAGPEGRLLLFDYGEEGSERTAGTGEGFLLRLVRSIPNGERRHPHLRNSGGVAGAAEAYTGTDPGAEGRKQLAPPSGLLEVCYALIQRQEDPQGILTLYRGVRTPALEAGGFFDEETGGSFDEKWVSKNLRPVATDILGLWVLCFGQDSEEWMEDEIMAGRVHAGGSAAVWDSTRGILAGDLFPLAVGPSSLNETRDDVFPRKVRIVTQVARGWSPDARLRRALEPEQVEILVNSTVAFPPEIADVGRYVKIGTEWMRLESMDSSSARIVRHSRGTRRHRTRLPVTTPVFAGRVFRKTLDLPVMRSHWLGDAK
jgi:hypothetical protein